MSIRELYISKMGSPWIGKVTLPSPYPDVLEPIVDVVGHDIHPEESVQEPELNDEAQDLAAHELRAWGVFKL